MSVVARSAARGGFSSGKLQGCRPGSCCADAFQVPRGVAGSSFELRFVVSMAKREYFKYGDNDLPAYRDDKGIMIISFGGKEFPPDDLWKFVHEATPISEAEFEELKARKMGSRR